MKPAQAVRAAIRNAQSSIEREALTSAVGILERAARADAALRTIANLSPDNTLEDAKVLAEAGL